jgi:CheY-like chemotaxis protein/anti-sigma regulatory factor (Ser/Thr protein kinase)
MRILVADDDSITRRIIQRVLESEGYAVSLAADGLEALASFKQSPPDIVITDFHMPRMDGVQLCRELKKAGGTRFVPIIMLTAGQDSDLLRNSLQAGALEFLNKPVQVDELVARVAALAAMADMHNTLASNQEETLGEIGIVKHLLERLTSPGLKRMPPGFAMETLQTRRINGDACTYHMGIGGTHFGLLCDATGHGLVAGVSTLPVLETFQAMASRDIPLESIYEEINAKLCRLLPADRFSCLIMFRLDPEMGLLSVLNAGMPDIFLLRKDRQEFRGFASRNFPAGIQAHAEAIEVEDVSVAPGDRIFACSDGLVDLFRDSILRKVFLRRATRFPGAENHAWLKNILLQSLKNVEQHDDLTWALWEVPPPMPLAVEQEPSMALEAECREGLALQFEMDPRVHQVRDLVPNILGLLGFKGVPPPALQKLGILLTEAFNNAVDHGLLGMDSAVKSQGFDVYEAGRKEALARFKGGMARCRLSLRYLGANPPILHHIKIEVSDDGPGFAWDTLLGSDSPDLPVPYGRGVPMMKALAPDFRFNETGNAVHFSVVC